MVVAFGVGAALGVSLWDWNRPPSLPPSTPTDTHDVTSADFEDIKAYHKEELDSLEAETEKAIDVVTQHLSSNLDKELKDLLAKEDQQEDRAERGDFDPFVLSLDYS
jgi:hypothetical protein